MPTDIFPEVPALATAANPHFFFKCEDVDEDGVPIGPLWVEFGEGEASRSKRYVSIAEANHIARRFNSELTET